jgi:hypothetical protein
MMGVHLSGNFSLGKGFRGRAKAQSCRRFVLKWSGSISDQRDAGDTMVLYNTYSIAQRFERSQVGRHRIYHLLPLLLHSASKPIR